MTLHNRRRKQHHQSTMDSNHITTRHRNKLWFVFFVLFFFWYVLLYGYDWSSLPGLSSISRNQEDSLQSSESNPIPKSDDDDVPRHQSLESNINPESDDVVPDEKNKENPTPKSDDVVPENKNDSIVSDANYESNNVSKNATDDDTDREEQSIESDPIEDLASLEKELESSLPKEEEDKVVEKGTTRGKPCIGRYIYVHDLPTRFNDDYIKQCKLLNKWHDMCQYFVNSGLGQTLGNPQRLFLRLGWYITHQFSLEVIFHNRMKQYECLTNDSSKAAAIYVPYYPGLDVSRYLWDDYNTSVKDADSLELFKWLRQKPEWSFMNGRDHFLVSGRITWDFRRMVDNDSEWGNKLMVLPESQNITMITIESSPWDKNDFAIPYPTYFHPRTDDQVYEWQNKMRRQKRRSLFCFAGAPRPNMEDSIRGEIMAQCTASGGRKCKMIECKNDKHNCLKPVNVMRMFQSSVFCLQPPGDSFTRRSTFDSILAGCIPVFFSPGSAYVQYLWHLPKDFGSYSVLIPEGEVKQKKVNIDSLLSQIPKAKVAAMREKVIKLIPNVIYADPRSRLKKLDDAFDLTVRGVIERVESLRKEMKEGRNNSDEFDSEGSWKYYTFGTTKEHEWDHYFKRG